MFAGIQEYGVNKFMPGVSKSLSNEASIDYNYLNKVVAESKKDGVNANPKEVK